MELFERFQGVIETLEELETCYIEAVAELKEAVIKDLHKGSGHVIDKPSVYAQFVRTLNTFLDEMPRATEGLRGKFQQVRDALHATRTPYRSHIDLFEKKDE